MNYFFSRIFINAFNDMFPKRRINYNKENLEELEKTLQDFVYKVVGFKFGNNYNLGEIRSYFDNICRHLNLNRNLSLTEAIKKYQDEYINLINSYPYIKLFIDVLKRIYSEKYDGKLLSYSEVKNEKESIKISHHENTLIIFKQGRQGDLLMPAIKINNFDRFEEILERYISLIKNSDTYYNIFNKIDFDNYTEEEKIKIIFEGTILNASNCEFASIEKFFDKYCSFISDNSFDEMKRVQQVGNAFNDELYFAVKKSSVEYETPFYFSFMLKNHRFELPNTRIAISETTSKKIAYIMATQSSQMTPPNKEISEYIKQNIPRTSLYRTFNPDHMISIVLTFGILNGIGINDVVVIDYMPLRCHKTIKDKSMNLDEAANYINRVVNKNIYTYFKLASLANGIDIQSIPDGGQQLSIHLDKEITFNSDFLSSLYNMAYEYGKKYEIENFMDRKK